ncbi:hypothetical protein WJX74_002766 [Apatococcus lobatus]|uniref:Glutathione S-transferase n=2 Tax=Apatococcus TaxID=904362 RepID=A0AAW1SNZ4_9CHLO
MLGSRRVLASKVYGPLTAARRPLSAQRFVRTMAQYRPDKPTVIDLPVSNNGARVRWIIYKKGLEQQYAIVSPKEIGGFKSDIHMALHPLGKVPCLGTPDGLCLAESEVLVQYIADKHKGVGPSLEASTPEKRALAHQAVRFQDLYILNIFASMYRKMDKEPRAEQIGQINTQLDNLEKLVVGPYVVGDELTTADGSLLPNLCWMNYILPQLFGWENVFKNRPKLAACWQTIQQDEAASKVIAELHEALDNWKNNGRWKDVGVLEHVKDKSFQWSY